MHRYCSDVVIHIDEELPDDDIYQLERDLGSVPGVYSACVNDRARHLLNMVRQHGVGAELIGL